MKRTKNQGYRQIPWNTTERFLTRTKVAHSRSNTWMDLATDRALRTAEKRSLISTEFTEGRTNAHSPVVMSLGFCNGDHFEIAKRWEILCALKYTVYLFSPNLCGLTFYMSLFIAFRIQELILELTARCSLQVNRKSKILFLKSISSSPLPSSPRQY